MLQSILTLLIALVILAAIIIVVFLKKQGSGNSGNQVDYINKSTDRIENTLRAEMSNSRQEIQGSLKSFSDSSFKQVAEMVRLNEEKFENIRKTVEDRLKSIQSDSTQKLEMIRETVDEKLHDTLGKRLGESFKIVNENLEKVHQGLGEMRNLAAVVGDLNKVLSDVKPRGVLGEIQLKNLLEEVLTPDQYEENVATREGSDERVEFAVKLPGNKSKVTYLPIDAKFPTADYQELLEAQEKADVAGIRSAGKALEARIKQEAKDIRDKYINPPNTVDFGILFLPFEGLYAEVLRRPGLFEFLQREYRVVVTGPTTIAAFLNSLRMGFSTLAIEKRVGEVWDLLRAVKTEFGRFGETLKKAGKKLDEAKNSIDDATKRTTVIERKLKDMEVLPPDEAGKMLEQGDTED